MTLEEANTLTSYCWYYKYDKTLIDAYKPEGVGVGANIGGPI